MDAKDPRHPDHLPTVTPLETATAPSLHLERLKEARDRGGVFLWMGLAGAFAWWIAAFGGSVALLGLDQLSEYSSSVIAAGAVALAIPGLMLLMAGLLARENTRAASTNAVVLEAAARLLAPLETAGSNAQTFAGQMRQSAGEVDRSMAHALSSMKAMAGEISDERQRLETVSYVTADNAKELSARLGDERKALETLAADIYKQTEMMSEAIPRQAAQMRDSARAAAADIAQADQALEMRLENLNSASSKLTDKVSSLDQMSVEAARRSEELVFAVTRMEEKLELSRKMVDKAVRAGELVAASASTTGDRLTDSVNAALERARLASRDIQAEALEAAEKAARSLAALKAAGEEAAQAVRAARAGAEGPGRMPPQPAPVDRELEGELPKRGKPLFSRERPSPSQPKLEEDDVFEETHRPSPQTGYTPAAPEKAPAADINDEEDLFEPREKQDYAARAEESPVENTSDAATAPDATSPEKAAAAAHSETDVEGQAIEEDAEETPEPPRNDSGPIPFFRRRTDRAPSYLKPVTGGKAVNLAAAEAVDEDEDEAPAVIEPSSAEPVEEETPEAEMAEAPQWGDIIADMEGEDHEALPREENAQDVIQRLMDSGVRLGEIFRPRDKKKIANAARKGDGLRRKAIVDAAARQVQRVQKRLDNDRQLMMHAREFLSMEEDDALMALDKTCHSSKNASPRLAAFLLIDAALG